MINRASALKVAAAIIALLGTTLIQPSPAFADDPPTDRDSIKTSVSANALLMEPGKPATTQRLQIINHDRCETVRANLAKFAEQAKEAGKSTVGCWGKNPSIDTRTADTMPEEFPSWCSDANDIWITNRVIGCKLSTGWVEFVGVPSGVIEARVEFNMYDMITTPTNMGRFLHEQYMRITGKSGKWTDITRTILPDCTGSCQVGTSTGIGSTRMTDVGFITGDTVFDSNLARGQKGAMFSEMTISLAYPSSVNFVNIPNELDSSSPIRCDHGLLKGGDAINQVEGCVFREFAPSLNYSRTDLRQLTDHIAYAQWTMGLAGRPGDAPLHRIYDDADIAENGNVACENAPTPRPTGLQCDEYPFRSTKEGAYTGGGFFSCRLIDATQNSRGGGLLGSFYNANRIILNDPFWVTFTPPYTSSPPQSPNAC